MLNLNHILFALFIACTAVIYTCELTEPGEIFGFWKRWLDEKLNTPERSCKGLDYHPLYKVLAHCEKCISGQLSFWIFLAYNYNHYYLITIIPHLLFTGFTIFLAVVIKKAHSILTK